MTSSPDPAAIRQQLDRMLASEAFAGAGRHTRVLRYLVERTLAGEGDQLKEYVLGTEVFDRDATYDPRVDSIVRVEVRRLRTRLEDYYRGPGANDHVGISIPRGGYVPVFTDRPPASSAVTPASADEFRGNGPRASVAMVAAAIVVAVALIVGTLAVDSSRQPGAHASAGPAIAVLPFQHYSSSERDANLAAHLTDAVTAELARLGTISVRSRTSAGQFDAEAVAAPAIARALNVTFLIEASAVRTGEDLRVVARLVDAQRDRKVWVGEYGLTPPEIPGVAQQIAAEAANAALAYAPR